MADNSDIDIEALMERIKSEAKVAIGNAKPVKRYQSKPQQFHDGNDSPLLYAEELNYLNRHWSFNPEATPFQSHRPVLGKVIVAVKRRLRSLIWSVALSGFSEYSKNFNANLVRHLNHAARYIEARNAKLFWNLIHKVDSDVASMNDRTDQLFDMIAAESVTKIAELEKRIAELELLIGNQAQTKKSSNAS